MISGCCLGLVGQPKRTGGSRETGQFPGTGCETLGAPREGVGLSCWACRGHLRKAHGGLTGTDREPPPWYRGGSSVKPGSRNGGAAGSFGVLKEM